MKNKTGNYYQRGSVSALAIMAILFFVVVIAAIMPMTNTEMKFAAANRNETEARYAAEAGAKRAIAEMLAEQTSWSWLEDTKGATEKQAFISDKPVNDYYYSVFIETVAATPVPLTGKPVIGQQYKITSTGFVNGSKKVVSVIYKMNAGGSIPTSALYVKGDLYAKQSLEVDGDIVVGGTRTNVSATGSITEGTGVGAGMKIPTYDFEEYKKDAVELPNIVYTGTTDGIKNYSLPAHTSNFTISPTAKTKYYVDGNLSIEENNLKITATNAAVIFVKNNLSIPSNSLALTGHIMLISGGVDVSEYNNTNFSNIVIVSSGNVSFKNNTTIVGILAVEGNLDFKAGKTTVTGNENLAKEFNNLMGNYELGGGVGTTAGEAEITNWKIE